MINIKQPAEIAKSTRNASRQLAVATIEQRVRALVFLSEKLSSANVIKESLQRNSQDLKKAKENGRDAAYLDRLTLSKNRILSLSKAILDVSKLPDPIGQIEEERKLPSGISVSRMLIPLGVILVIYEARPGVSIESAALCIMSGNAVLLRGATDSMQTNNFLIDLIKASLENAGLPTECVVSLAGVTRDGLTEFLALDDYLDLVIPRGGSDLVRSIKERSKIPVLAHAEGVCHVYIHASADYDTAEKVLINSKLQRPSVCNAAECLLIDAEIAPKFLPRLASALEKGGAEIRACAESFLLLKNTELKALSAAKSSDFGKEFLSPCIAVKIVQGFDSALNFIVEHGTQHTEAIVAKDTAVIERFLRSVRASCVTANASTRFNDGGQLGLGAEIGISTTPLHAFGPMGLKELCARKFVVKGNGSIRE